MISNVDLAMNYKNRNITFFAPWVRKGKARIKIFALVGPGSEAGLCFHLVSQEADFTSLLLCFWNKSQ